MQAHNFKLLAQHTLNGHGGMGEGMSLQLARGGRRILWLAHESAPKNFTGVDVTDPRKPKVVVQTDLPHAIAQFDASGPNSRGCHQLWFVDGKTVHMACSDPELKPRDLKDDQVYRIIDVSNPSTPTPVGRWH